MPRVNKKVADLKNRIADTMVVLLDASEKEMLKNLDEFGEEKDISQACEIIRNAILRRKSV